MFRSSENCHKAVQFSSWWHVQQIIVSKKQSETTTNQDTEDTEVWHNPCSHEVFADYYFQKIALPVSHMTTDLSLTTSALGTQQHCLYNTEHNQMFFILLYYFWLPVLLLLAHITSTASSVWRRYYDRYHTWSVVPLLNTTAEVRSYRQLPTVKICQNSKTQAKFEMYLPSVL